MPVQFPTKPTSAVAKVQRESDIILNHERLWLLLREEWPLFA